MAVRPVVGPGADPRRGDRRRLPRDGPAARPERARGYRSSWNFVGARYQVDDEMARSLQDDGCEAGVHGLLHDGRDLEERFLDERLPAMWENAKRWDAVGFRSPATHRGWELMHRLGFDYDSSYSDTDPYEPQPGGCCTYLPYFNRDTVELPITLPQDHTLFTILQHADGDLWLRKARHIRDRGGMVLVLTHPDYAGDQRLAQGYEALLDTFAGDETVWHALPKEVATWWRRRAASTIRGHGDGWVIDGPASDAGRVCFAEAGSIVAKVWLSLLTECPDDGVADAPQWGGHDDRAHRGEPHPGDPQKFEPEVAGEKLRHRTDSEAANVVTVADMKRRRLAARQQQQAVVQGGEVGDGHHENASGPQYPPRLPQGGTEILHRDQLAVPDHQVEVAVGGGECRCLDIDMMEVRRGAHGRIAGVFTVVDSGTARVGKLVTEQQGLTAARRLDLQEAAAIGRQGLDHAGDLTDRRRLRSAGACVPASRPRRPAAGSLGQPAATGPATLP